MKLLTVKKEFNPEHIRFVHRINIKIMESTAAQILSNKVSEMKPSATIAMAQKARNLKTKGYDIISLSLGEPDFDTPQHIVDAAKQALEDGYTRYTPVPGLVEFRNAIVEKFERDNNLIFSPDQIVVSNGAKQSIANVCQALLNEGDEVIIFTPYWVSYYEIVKYAGGVPICVSANIDQDYKVTPDQVKKAISHKTKAVIFSSPCNPTGSVYSFEELAALAEVLSQKDDLIIISDEIYEYINFSGSHASIGAIDSVKDRTVTINGMSKGFAMTGWRLGYMGAPAWIASACSKVQSQVTSGAASFSQMAAAHGLKSDLSPTFEMTKAFEKRKKLVLEGLSEIPGMKLNNPMGAFYVFPDISEYFGKTNGKTIIDNSIEFCEILLEEAHVATVAGSAFGADDCFRISYAASEKDLMEAIKRIKKTLSTYF